MQQKETPNILERIIFNGNILIVNKLIVVSFVMIF